MDALSKIFYGYFQKRIFPYWGIIMLDILAFIVSAFFVVAVNNSLTFVVGNFYTLACAISFYLIFFVIGFKLFRTYSGIIRFSSFVDLQRIAGAIIFGMVTSIAIHIVLEVTKYGVILRIRDLILASALVLAIMWAERVVVKFCYDMTFHASNAVKVFIYGTRSGGVSIAKSLRNQSPAKFVLQGFVSDDSTMLDKMLMGVHIFMNDNKLIDTMQRLGVTALLVSPMKSETLRENSQMVNALIDAHIKIYMVPSEQEWDGKSMVSHGQLHEIDIEDLLPRQKINLDLKAVGGLLSDQVILITGAAGSIGSEIVRQVAQFNPRELVMIDQAETPLHDIRLMMNNDYPGITAHTILADVTVAKRMEDIFSEYRPDYVFHAAAYKHVPMMEDNPGESVHNNIYGTRVMADLAVKYGTRKFVLVSTDKAVNPTNVMGCSKRICEIYVQSLDKAIKEGTVEGQTQFVTTRFGNVLGSNGSVIPLFKEQIRRGGPLTVTHPDIIRYFMLISEACKLVLEAGTIGNGGEIFVFDMGEPVKIVDLARRMIKLSGADIEIKFTGLRDGEKLYEDVLNDEEEVLPTFHPKIKIARVREYDYNVVTSSIDRLVQLAKDYNDMDIVRLMKIIVPEYKSMNSVYEALDNSPKVPKFMAFSRG